MYIHGYVGVGAGGDMQVYSYVYVCGCVFTFWLTAPSYFIEWPGGLPKPLMAHASILCNALFGLILPKISSFRFHDDITLLKHYK